MVARWRPSETTGPSPPTRMCVLICRVGEKPLLAANRDELYARPFSAPRRWMAGTPFWAPRDEEEGGTWIGVNAAGLMAGITNRSRLKEEPGRSSRGHLISGVLAAGGFDEADVWLRERLDAAAHNPCQVYIAQGNRARVFAVDGDYEERTLRQGIHVLSNLHDPGEIDFGLADDAGWDEMRPILQDTEPRLPRGFAVCKDAGWRGTVASALIEPGTRFLFAPGPPDTVAYQPVPGYASGDS